ncbi:hypothetical protein KM043_018534 [Ampulex compressa]|nr:hypothetical protein KM043_018534 [Ampulex compressa]
MVPPEEKNPRPDMQTKTAITTITTAARGRNVWELSSYASVAFLLRRRLSLYCFGSHPSDHSFVHVCLHGARPVRVLAGLNLGHREKFGRCRIIAPVVGYFAEAFARFGAVFGAGHFVFSVDRSFVRLYI